jgi:hypothetical protein
MRMSENTEPKPAVESEAGLPESHSPLTTPNFPPAPLTDSPFFWLIVFGVAALIGGVMIAPKYSKRMDRVERMYDARLKAYVERVGGDTSQMPVDMHREVSIRELLIFVAVILLGGGVAGRVWEVRQRPEHNTNADNPG